MFRKRRLLVLIGIAAAIACYCWLTRPFAAGPPPVEEWTQHFGGESCRAVLMAGPKGSVYVVHNSEHYATDGYQWSAFASKYSPDGKLVWTSELKTGDVDGASMSPDGCIYIPPGEFAVSGGTYNQITRVRPDGSLEDAARTDREVQCMDFLVDRFGSYFIQTWEYPQSYLCKFDPSGNSRFQVDDIKTGDPTGWDGQQMASDGSGGFICFKTEHFSSADSIFPRMSLVTRFGRTGKRLWTVDDFPHEDGPDQFCADPKGNIYVGGSVEYRDPHYNGSGSVFRRINEWVRNWLADRRYRGSGGRDCYIEKYDVHGKRLWSLEPRTSDEDYAGVMTADTDGNLYAVAAAGDGPKETYTLNKYSPRGRLLWTKALGNPLWTPVGLLADGKGHVYMLRSTGFEGEDTAIIKYTER